MALLRKLDIGRLHAHRRAARRLWSAGCLALLLIAAAACTSDPGDQPGMPDGEGGVRFGVERIGSRDLGYDGLHTTLADGEAVGCVIGAKSATSDTCEYLAYSKWQYCAATGMLVLKEVEYTYTTPKVNPWDPENSVYELYPWDKDKTANDVIWQDIVPGKKAEDDGYVVLKRQGVNYTFHWVYPFVEADAAKDDAKNHPCFDVQGQWGRSGTAFMATYLGKKHPNQWNTGTVNPSEWRNALCFVNPDQSTPARLCRSDYMTARTTALATGADINTLTAERAATQRVRLVKLNAAIEVVIEGDGTLSSVTFTSGAHKWANGTAFDVELNQRKPLDRAIEGVDSASWMRSTQMTLTPCPLQAGRRYRLVAAPQTLDGLTMNFSIDGTPYAAELAGKLTVLEANHLYTLRLRQSQDHSYVRLLVIRDWVDAGLSELDGWTGAYDIMPI